jgi:hypothetical protein
MRSALLVVVLGVSLGIPLALSRLLAQASGEMRARASLAPLVLGAKGERVGRPSSSAAMFFAASPPGGLAMRDLARVEAEGLARAVPASVGATARKTAVVGTTLDYLERAGALAAQGRAFATIGECVVGAAAARELALGVGASVFTDPDGLCEPQPQFFTAAADGLWMLFVQLRIAPIGAMMSRFSIPERPNPPRLLHQQSHCALLRLIRIRTRPAPLPDTHFDRHTRAFQLQLHRHTTVQVFPTAIQRLIHFFQRQLAKPHRHIQFAAHGHRQRRILMRQFQRKSGRVIFVHQELVCDAIESAACAPARPGARPSGDRRGSIPAFTPMENTSAIRGLDRIARRYYALSFATVAVPIGPI